MKRITNEHKVKEIEKYHELFVARMFFEDNVKGFMMAIRDYLPKRSQARDMCNFIAHPERNMGGVYDFAVEVYDILFKKLSENPNHISYDHPIFAKHPSFYIVELQREINSFFKGYGLSELTADLIKEIALCLIKSFRGNSVIRKGDNTQIGTLEINISNNKVALFIRIEIPYSKNETYVQSFEIFKINCSEEEVPNDIFVIDRDINELKLIRDENRNLNIQISTSKIINLHWFNKS